ncbi:unnamed protein product [Oncorhynchus mykiss]|uniref:Transposase Tc1-like domain-containing protein n=1 Tax=Oncorhynchus mykiss TaxID=8022 RepID=A0A060Z6Q5_ONCMY|nr:unnamed protein product [Oncorhynchus mykiss]
MGPRSRHTAQERSTYFGAKSANQSQNNSKGPCEDAGGNRYKSIYIQSKTSPISTLLIKKARLRFATAHGDKDRTFWRNILWSDETKIELFGHNDHRYVWRKKGEACKTKNTISTVKHGGGSIMLWGDWCTSQNRLHHEDGKLFGHIEATSQDISQEVKAWSQMGLPNGQ